MGIQAKEVEKCGDGNLVSTQRLGGCLPTANAVQPGCLRQPHFIFLRTQ